MRNLEEGLGDQHHQYCIVKASSFLDLNIQVKFSFMVDFAKFHFENTWCYWITQFVRPQVCQMKHSSSIRVISILGGGYLTWKHE
jgi:hypothetical protein